MPKIKIRTVVVKCECSTCGQIASVEPNQPHFHCRGFKILEGKALPKMFLDLKNHKRRGTWIPVPPKAEASQEVSP